MAEQKHDENMIAALRRERAGYVARGDDDRVAQVDEQSAPKGRTAARRQTADAGRPGGEGKA